jgi:hypothetical protein
MLMHGHRNALALPGILLAMKSTHILLRHVRPRAAKMGDSRSMTITPGCADRASEAHCA